ncbi:zinc ribbon domain-containing protein [Chloroflexota bacterium]
MVLIVPIYEYQCVKCGERFELLRRINDKDSEIKCPKCGKLAANRMLSTFATASSNSSCVVNSHSGST